MLRKLIMREREVGTDNSTRESVGTPAFCFTSFLPSLMTSALTANRVCRPSSMAAPGAVFVEGLTALAAGIYYCTDQDILTQLDSGDVGRWAHDPAYNFANVFSPFRLSVQNLMVGQENSGIPLALRSRGITLDQLSKIHVGLWLLHGSLQQVQ